MESVKEVLQIFDAHNVTLNLDKSVFFTTKVEYLAYHHVRQFLCLIEHFRKLVPHFALNSKPRSQEVLV